MIFASLNPAGLLCSLCVVGGLALAAVKIWKAFFRELR